MTERRSKGKVILGIVAAVLLIAAFGAGVYYLDHRGDGAARSKGPHENTQRQKFLDGDRKYYITNNVETYLLIGTDATGQEEREDGKYQGAMADFLMLFIMDKTDNQYRLLEIDRNTVTDVHLLDENGEDADWDEEQICTAHWYGTSEEQSNENTVMTVSDLLYDLPIDGYYSVNMENIRVLNHAVGGVTLTIQEDLTRVDPAFRKGATLTLSDDQAEKFVRIRMGVDDEKNTARMARQEQYLEAFRSQVTERCKTDPEFINELTDQFQDIAVTDISGNRLSAIANFLYKAEGQPITHIEGKTTIGYVLGDGIPHEEFYADDAALLDTLKNLFGIGGARGEETE